MRYTKGKKGEKKERKKHGDDLGVGVSLLNTLWSLPLWSLGQVEAVFLELVQF